METGWGPGLIWGTIPAPLFSPLPLLTAQLRPLLAPQAPPQGAPLARCPHSASSGPLTQPASGPAPDPLGSVSTWRVEKENTDLPSSLILGGLPCLPPARLVSPAEATLHKQGQWLPNTPPASHVLAPQISCLWTAQGHSSGRQQVHVRLQGHLSTARLLPGPASCISRRSPHLAGCCVLRTRFLWRRERRAGQGRALPGATCSYGRRPLESSQGYHLPTPLSHPAACSQEGQPVVGSGSDPEPLGSLLPPLSAHPWSLLGTPLQQLLLG